MVSPICLYCTMVADLINSQCSGGENSRTTQPSCLTKYNSTSVTLKAKAIEWHMCDSIAAHKKAQEAQAKADELKQRYEANDWQDNAQIDLHFAVQACLAHCCHMAGLDQEALGIYTSIVRSAEYHMAGRLRVNIGNIYFKREQWTEAIKQYRMALDQLPNERQACCCAMPCHDLKTHTSSKTPRVRWSLNVHGMQGVSAESCQVVT